MSARFKKETGVIPVRSRRCDREMFRECHWFSLGRRETLMT